MDSLGLNGGVVDHRYSGCAAVSLKIIIFSCLERPSNWVHG